MRTAGFAHTRQRSLKRVQNQGSHQTQIELDQNSVDLFDTRFERVEESHNRKAIPRHLHHLLATSNIRPIRIQEIPPYFFPFYFSLST